jgi:NADH-quinone oxidoreductase subunit I
MKLIKDVIHTFASLLKGLRVTLLNWSILRPSVTELYPEEKPKLPERFRGMPTLPRDKATGFCRCIGCGACARVCPENIITVTQDKSDPKNRKPEEFTIDISRCMFCGLCMEVCPVKCLKSAKSFELTCRSRKDMVYDLNRLMDMGGEFPEEPVAPSPHPSPAGGEGDSSPKGESQ